MRNRMSATGLRYKELTTNHATEVGCLSALQRLQRQGLLSHRELLCVAAARTGQLEELKPLRENGCPRQESTCWTAAQGGHLVVLQWVHANGCPWSEYTCGFAAEGGHIEMLQWLCENGCPWDYNTCNSAAKKGHLEVLQWAHENGCTCEEFVYVHMGGEGRTT